MALIKHKYSDVVVDNIWKAKEEVSKSNSLVVSTVQVGKDDYAVRLVEEGAIRRDKGEVVLADNRTLHIFLRKFNTYTKEQSTQFFYHAINTLIDKKIAVGASIA